MGGSLKAVQVHMVVPDGIDDPGRPSGGVCTFGITTSGLLGVTQLAYLRP